MFYNLKKNYFILVSTFFILYIFFNLMSGERGLVSYLQKKKILQNLNEKEKQLVEKIDELDLKNSLLSDNLDLDYIEILIRQRFLFGKKGEKIYIIKNNETKN